MNCDAAFKLAVWWGAISSAALPACADAGPGDATHLSELSPQETVALCDEFGDDSIGAGAPLQCEDGTVVRWGNANDACAAVDLSTCSALVGDARQCHDWMKRDPCLAVRHLAQICGQCSEALGLMPSSVVVSATACAGATLEGSPYEGIYEVDSTQPYEVSEECPALFRSLRVAGAQYFVLVATPSGVAHFILKSCRNLLDCADAARQTREDPTPQAADMFQGGSYGFEACNGTPALLSLMRQPRPADCWSLPGAPEILLTTTNSAVGTRSYIDVTISLSSPPSALTPSEACGAFSHSYSDISERCSAIRGTRVSDTLF
jgi:hypothetical protein